MNPAVFYILGAAATVTTLMAITRSEVIHAVVYLVLSFFSIALIFYMMGAPLIAALEVIVYAGAIMVLFLFIIMMLEMGTPGRQPGKQDVPFYVTWGPAALAGLVIVVCACVLFGSDAVTAQAPGSVFISPRDFGHALFTKQTLAVEAVSLMLLFALVGALYLGRRD